LSIREEIAKTSDAPAVVRGNFGQWLVYAAYRVFEGAFVLVPLTVCFLFGRFAGWIAHLILPGYRKLVRRNLAIAFEGEKSAAEIRQLARDHFVTLGGNLVSSIKLGVMPREKVEARLTIVGLENRDAAEKLGRGLVYLICHMGSWEILARAKEVSVGSLRGSLYQPLSNPFMDRLIRNRREQDGTHLFNRSEGFYSPIRHLKAGGVLGVLVDQHAGDKGVWCPFFGRLASTSNLAPLLALKTGAPMLSLGLYTRGLARWELVIHPPIDPKGEGGGKIEPLTAVMNGHLADVISESPQDWFWVHNRWKTPKPNFLINSYKRGSVLPDGMNVSDLKRFSILVSSPNPLGDACMAIPAVKALKRGRPDAWVAVLVPEGIADVWRTVDEVDAVIPKERRGKPVETAKRITDVAAFDVAILFPNSQRSAMEVTRAGIPRVVGYRGKLRSRHIDQIIKEPDPGPTVHHVNHYLDVVAKCGADVDDASIFDPPKHTRSDPHRDLVKVGLCPGAEYGDSKRWPPEKYAAAAVRVADEMSGKIEWQLFGSPGEVEIGEKLEAMLQGKVGFQNRIGKTSVNQLMDEMRECEVILTNDTGTLHLAAYLGVKVVAVFGSTDPIWTGPLGEGHRVIRHHVECGPCFLRECPMDFRCMDAVIPEEVSAAVLELLAQDAALV
jgi:heptosyltransferase-2